MLLSVVAYGLGFAGLACTAVALWGRPCWYWTAGLCTYLFSVMAGFSIGPYTVSLAFIQFGLAMAHSAGWARTRGRSLAVVLSSLAAYALMLPVQWLLWLPARYWFLPLLRLLT